MSEPVNVERDFTAAKRPEDRLLDGTPVLAPFHQRMADGRIIDSPIPITPETSAQVRPAASLWTRLVAWLSGDTPR